ncbi:hypothetical protein FJY93_00205 [Candidatus Kaiserbacteria bacterium]|nr:hypothetical protein [Candidatus Kaiserbacteria bacterium]
MKYPYFLGVVGIIALLAIGGAIVDTRVPIGAGESTYSGGTPIYFDTSSYAPYQPSTQNQTPDDSTPAIPTMRTYDSFSYTPDPSKGSATNIPSTIIHSDSSFDFNAFMQKLSSSGTSASQIPVGTSINTPIIQEESYPFVPPELFSSPDAPPARSALQQELYTYGNTAGSFLKTYEQMHANDVAVMQRFFDTRTSAPNTTALRQVANDFKAVGLNMKTVQQVPAPAASIHKNLAESYIVVADKMIAMLSTANDEDFIQAVLTYNAAVEENLKHLVALIDTFANNGVKFGPSESGSVFMFSSVGL